MTSAKAVKPLDTLTLAYFMAGDRAKAIETQQKAVAMLPSGESSTRTELEANLAKYRAELTGEDAGNERRTNEAGETP